MLPAAAVGAVPGRALGCSLLGNQGHCRAALSPCHAAASPREWGIPAKLQGAASQAVCALTEGGQISGEAEAGEVTGEALNRLMYRLQGLSFLPLPRR